MGRPTGGPLHIRQRRRPGRRPGLQDGRDQLDFSAFGFGDVGEVLDTATQVGAHVVFELEPDTRVTVLRAELADFDSGDFLL